MHEDELRRAARVRVCCRVDVRQPHAVWSAVTEDLSARGCRIITAQNPRLGSRFPLTLSSDLFSEELVTVGEVVWVSAERLGILFVEEAKRNGSLSPVAWLERVMTYGASPDFAHLAAGHVVPALLGGPRKVAAIPILSRRRSG